VLNWFELLIKAMHEIKHVFPSQSNHFYEISSDVFWVITISELLQEKAVPLIILVWCTKYPPLSL